MNNSKYFIQEWAFFNNELEKAQRGEWSLLTGKHEMFCDLVILKAVAIAEAPAPNAYQTPLSHLCGEIPDKEHPGRYYAMDSIKELGNQYHIVLKQKNNASEMPVSFTIVVAKEDFDYYLDRLFCYVNPDILQNLLFNE